MCISFEINTGQANGGGVFFVCLFILFFNACLFVISYYLQIHGVKVSLCQALQKKACCFISSKQRATLGCLMQQYVYNRSSGDEERTALQNVNKQVCTCAWILLQSPHPPPPNALFTWKKVSVYVFAVNIFGFT